MDKMDPSVRSVAGNGEAGSDEGWFGVPDSIVVMVNVMIKVCGWRDGDIIRSVVLAHYSTSKEERMRNT